MMADFFTRLAVALPLVCLAAAAWLLAARRFGLPLPGLPRRMHGAAKPSAGPAVLAVLPLGPGARIAVVRFGGNDLLIGTGSSGMSLLATSPAADAAPAAPAASSAPAAPAAIEETPPCRS